MIGLSIFHQTRQRSLKNEAAGLMKNKPCRSPIAIHSLLFVVACTTLNKCPVVIEMYDWTVDFSSNQTAQLKNRSCLV
jgi:hypothetical protein